MEDSLLKIHEILKNIYAFWFQWCKKSKSSQSKKKMILKIRRNHTVYIYFLKGKRKSMFAKEKWQTLQNWLQSVATMNFHGGWFTPRVTMMWCSVNTSFGAGPLFFVLCHNFPVIFLTNSGVIICSTEGSCAIVKLGY